MMFQGTQTPSLTKAATSFAVLDETEIDAELSIRETRGVANLRDIVRLI